jgi:hypothetical protein
MYLTEAEVNTYYPKAGNMAAPEVKLFLQRANSYAYGILGGKPNFSTLPTEEAETLETGLKAAVALAFEFFTRGETAQVNPLNGNITEAAPAGYFQRAPGKQYQLEQVDKMLKPYADLFDRQNTVQSDRGVSFL